MEAFLILCGHLQEIQTSPNVPFLGPWYAFPKQRQALIEDTQCYKESYKYRTRAIPSSPAHVPYSTTSRRLLLDHIVTWPSMDPHDQHQASIFTVCGSYVLMQTGRNLTHQNLTFLKWFSLSSSFFKLTWDLYVQCTSSSQAASFRSRSFSHLYPCYSRSKNSWASQSLLSVFSLVEMLSLLPKSSLSLLAGHSRLSPDGLHCSRLTQTLHIHTHLSSWTTGIINERLAFFMGGVVPAQELQHNNNNAV